MRRSCGGFSPYFIHSWENDASRSVTAFTYHWRIFFLNIPFDINIPLKSFGCRLLNYLNNSKHRTVIFFLFLVVLPSRSNWEYWTMNLWKQLIGSIAYRANQSNDLEKEKMKKKIQNTLPLIIWLILREDAVFQQIAIFNVNNYDCFSLFIFIYRNRNMHAQY